MCFLLGPPSAPRNLRVVEANLSKIRVCWEKPQDHGTPNLAGYKIFNNYTREEFDEISSTNVTCCADISHFIKQSTTELNLTVVAFSKSENKSVESIQSNSVMLIMGKSSITSYLGSLSLPVLML